MFYCIKTLHDLHCDGHVRRTTTTYVTLLNGSSSSSTHFTLTYLTVHIRKQLRARTHVYTHTHTYINAYSTMDMTWFRNCLSTILLVQILIYYIHIGQTRSIKINAQHSKNLRRESIRRSAQQLQKVLQPVSNNNLVVQQAGFAANTGGTNTTNTSSAACSAADVTLLTDTAFEGDFKTGLRKDVVIYFYKPNPHCPACKIFKPNHLLLVSAMFLCSHFAQFF